MADPRMSAMNTNPSTTAPQQNDTARRQARLQYLQRIRPNDPQIKLLQQQLGLTSNQPSSGQPGAPGASTKPLSAAEIAKQGFQQAGQNYSNISNQFNQFNPYNMSNAYQPGFEKQMNQVRSNMMNTFERRNKEQFATESADIERQIAERGLDPTSPAADYLRRANTTRQDLARQEAMSAAESGAWDVQGNLYKQAYDTAMMPYQQWQAISDPFSRGLQNQYDMQQLAQKQKYDKWALQKELANRLQVARSSGGGGGGSSDAMRYQEMLNQLILNQYGQDNSSNKPNLGNSFATGAVTGGTIVATK